MKTKVNVGTIVLESVRLYRQHWKIMLAMGLMLAVVNLFYDVVLLQFPEIGGQVITGVVGFLLLPVLTFGFYRYQIKVWREEQPDWKEILHYCRTPKRYGTALWFEVCYWLLLFLLTIAVVIIFMVVVMLDVFSATSFWLSVIFYVILVLFFIWVILRLFLVSYCYLFQQEKSAWKAVSDSFSIMKGNCWRLFLLLVVQFIIGCFYEIPSLLLTGTTNTDVNHLFSFATTETGLVVIFLCTFVGTVLIQPLALLMGTGFANQLLLDKQLADTDLQEAKEEITL